MRKGRKHRRRRQQPRRPFGRAESQPHWKRLDNALRLRLADLDSKRFEDFFLHFFNAGVQLTIQRNRTAVTKRAITAETYAAGSGKKQHGIDLRVAVDGGEVWCVQCKRHKKWTRTQTKAAIKKARAYKAGHFILAVACDPGAAVHEEISSHKKWSLWNLDKICAEFRLRVPAHRQAQILSFLGFEQSEIKRFVGLATRALVTPREFFARYLDNQKTFTHDWRLVGRNEEIRKLTEFLKDSSNRVLSLVSKGGDGKSKLLWEFTRQLEEKDKGAHVLVFNPHSNDQPDFAFHSDANVRLLVIDDAHRTEAVPTSLLAAAASDEKCKIILATRPQGLPALNQKLFEVGLASLHTTISLQPLKQRSMGDLARQVLGADQEDHATSLLKLTADSVFMMVVAANLLRTGSLRWGGWASDREFREHVFRAFEAENMRHILNAQRHAAAGLLRLIAVTAPFASDIGTIEKAAKCLASTTYEVESLLHQMHRTDLIAPGPEGFRIIPDLFGDFLVYDACFEPSAKTPIFIKKILNEFQDRAGALLRNLAEAAWVARVSGVLDCTLLKPLIDAHHDQFSKSSFWERSQMVKHWGTFAVYLPEETISLTRLAVNLTTAPGDSGIASLLSDSKLDSYRYMLEQVPHLLKLIATFHEPQRGAASDLLWDLAQRMSWYPIINNQNHPYSMLGELFTLQPQTSVITVLQMLDWLRRRLQQPDALAGLNSNIPIIPTLLRPCFARFVEFREWTNRSLRWWEQPLIVEATNKVRETALAIITSITQNGSWKAALQTLPALAEGIRRIGPFESAKVKNMEEFRSMWKPERLKALAVCESIAKSHSNTIVRYELRSLLLRDIAFDEDREFAALCQRVVEMIPMDLGLRTAIAVLTHGHYDFLDQGAHPRTPEGIERGMVLWKEHVETVARDLVASHAAPDELFAFLHRLASDFADAGKHPLFEGLFSAIAKNAPEAAAQLAKYLIDPGEPTPLARAWPSVLPENLPPGERLAFLKSSLASTREDVRAATISALTRRPKADVPLSEEEQQILFALSESSTAGELRNMLQLIQWAGPSNLGFAYTLLARLKLAQHAPHLLQAIFEALVPYEPRAVPPPVAAVEHVLSELVDIPDIDIHAYNMQWEALCNLYPRSIYQFVIARITRASSAEQLSRYQAIPSGYHTALRLPQLVNDPGYQQIVDTIWAQVLYSGNQSRYQWRLLFQAVVLNNPTTWLPRMLFEVSRAGSYDDLMSLRDLIDFDGSLIPFRQAELTARFLQQAEQLAGPKGRSEMMSALYRGCGPKIRGYSGGQLDKEDDYIEQEASKAAADHKANPILSSFYEWVAERERSDKAWHIAQAAAETAE